MNSSFINWWKMSYHNGHVYEGEWKDDMPSYLGQGKYTWPDGDVYEGEWKDGKRHGQGKYTYFESGKTAIFTDKGK